MNFLNMIAMLDSSFQVSSTSIDVICKPMHKTQLLCCQNGNFELKNYNKINLVFLFKDGGTALSLSDCVS